MNEIGEIYRIRRNKTMSPGSVRREYWTGHHWGTRGKFYQLKELKQALKCHEHGSEFQTSEGVSIEVELYSVKLHKTVGFDEVR